ncbi:kinase-like domain-containing protein [Emericellopsis atlantica]|uniref:Kinase-like domain-containing protein n=1 Tax=Emericellopsis atlantica TaxID=2614577 RepID=A0A9P8CPV8_9HYPO|nr:kinase-like domain-containing protein [Emericellopsis atlantica]KAG9253141.1 kinase-like domain-containing protein [Emericellopsis atlantica]
MGNAYELPYYAPDWRLPTPLPSPHIIEENGEILQEQTGRRVVRFGNCYIIKYGSNVSLTEGKNMLFVRETQSVQVPEVFALYSTEDTEGQNTNYIVMENIPGHHLDTIWAQLDSSEKSNIASQLRVYFNALRNLPTPGYFGCIGRRPFEESMFWTAPEDDVEDGLISGPFDSEAEFNNALVQKYLYNSGLDPKAAYYRRVLPLVLRDHNPVFTHGDLQRKNIIIKESGMAVLIDWETAGWYPEYWEYALAMFACGAWQDDWHEIVGYSLAEYPNEYAWFDMLRRELWS